MKKREREEKRKKAKEIVNVQSGRTKEEKEKVSFICDRTLNTIDKRIVSTVIIEKRIGTKKKKESLN